MISSKSILFSSAMSGTATPHRLRIGMALIALVCVWSQMHSVLKFGRDNDCGLVVEDDCDMMDGSRLRTTTSHKQEPRNLKTPKVLPRQDMLARAQAKQKQQQQEQQLKPAKQVEQDDDDSDDSDDEEEQAKGEQTQEQQPQQQRSQKLYPHKVLTPEMLAKEAKQRQMAQDEAKKNPRKRPPKFLNKVGVESEPEHATPTPQFFNQLAASNDTSIRPWGCTPRNETPFIFVHIGKAGGGGVRSRMAAAALEYNRTGWHRTHQDPNYYYPVYDEFGDMHKGKFWSSTYPSWIPQSLPQFHGEFQYEGFGFCGATTPLGSAIACPNEQVPEFCKDYDNDTVSETRCDLVYVGHNVLGSEMHWLPTSYLVNWWNHSLWGQDRESHFVTQLLEERNLQVVKKWHVPNKVKEIVGGERKLPKINCEKGPYHYRDLRRNYKRCFQPKEAVVDKVYHHIMGHDDPMQAARLTASLPLMRVTVLREPFTWLLSKFFWHPQHWSRNNTEVVPDKGLGSNNQRKRIDKEKGRVTPPFVKCDDLEEAAGWVENRAMSYLFYLCGEHCMGAWATGTLSMEDLERQGAYNLRNSFAVVGLLHKTDEFYEMVKHRVFYMDTSLNPDVVGKSHQTSTMPESKRCKNVYKETAFQEELLSRSAALRALNRLYNVAVEVNEFQKQEMLQCGYKITPTLTSEPSLKKVSSTSAKQGDEGGKTGEKQQGQAQDPDKVLTPVAEEARQKRTAEEESKKNQPTTRKPPPQVLNKVRVKSEPEQTTATPQFFNQLAAGNDTSIRQWGCTPRNETPFIFVHIGKAGGGGVRSRMAAAALDYNRSGWHRIHEDPNYYYPVYDENGQMHKGKFLASIYPSWLPKSLPQFHSEFEYEGYGFCGATTPLGSAIACPNEQVPEFCMDHDNDTVSETRCDLVYMGHNVLGSELHWLPTSYLVKWWNHSLWAQDPESQSVAQLLEDRHLQVVKKWHVPDKVKEIVGGEMKLPKIRCEKGPYHYRDLKRNYKRCFEPKEAVVDKVYHHVMGHDDPMQAARLTASLPVVRVTVLREPFTWLLSKFFWHPQHWLSNNTVVVPESGPYRNNRRKDLDKQKNLTTPPFVKCDDLEVAAGWVENRALSYMFYLCGEHCMGAWGAGTLSMDDLERQSSYNLKNSFAVVGLLHKTDEFYQMVKHRVFYMDTSLNPDVVGKPHKTSNLLEARRCKDIWKNTTFQENLLSKSPALRAMNRLYNVAVEVNEFQKQEMLQCGYEIGPGLTSPA
ncbi:expressed unknown protein [Seminavis robusta]|uniref:Uncharacterized protein n=1 Tax=Seminavis robusta TaxID=568900 RepID=A0A9N8EGI1_9STRA|nr:expressed unknown protein [Seminavis robusta]|eukprot:Sro1047_g235150.1 n/a (1252) ;mRNA; f:19682-23605